MNHLSIIIYLIGTLSNLGLFFITFCIIFGSIWVLVLISFAVADHRTEKDEITCRTWLNRFGFWCVIFGFCGSLLPSEKTLILIASSEFADTIIHNEKIVGITDTSIDLLRTWITKETHTLQKEINDKPKKDD